MSDIAIPGVTSKYNTEKIIKALLDVEKIPLNRKEKERDLYKQQKSAWLKLNNKLTSVREAARALFGFENPFDEKIAESSNISVLTATAARTALEQEKSVVIKHVATADRFVSRSLDKDFRAEKGVYRFSVGDKEVKFTFQGGSLKELANAINRKAGNLIKASVVDDTKKTRVIIIESIKTGSVNQLTLHDQALSFGEKAGIIEMNPQASHEIPVPDGTLTMNPGNELKLPISPTIMMDENMVMSFEIKTIIIPEETREDIIKPSGPKLPEVGEIEFQDIRVKSAISRTVLPEWEPPELQKKIEDMQFLFVEGGGTSLPAPEIKDSADFYTLTIEASNLPKKLEALILRNRNTHRKIQIKNIKIFDKTARGDYRPVNPLSTAEDSEIILDGIKVVRGTNTIDDLIPGVNITLHTASDTPVKLKIDKDMDTIKNTLFKFVGLYNQLLTQVDILTRRDEAIIENAQHLNDDEKEKAREELGLFIGNVTLMQLKTRLQRIMMDPYPTEGERELSMLAQIGISTSAGSQFTATIDKTRLRGYLQIDESKLDEALTRHAVWIKQMFGFDTDKDLIIDSGIAYKTEGHLKSFIEPDGVVSSRINTLNNSISRKDREIENYNEHLIDYERELKKKYGIMESALDSLEKSSQTIENLNRQTENR